MADLEELAARRRAALMDKQQKRMRFTRALNRSPLACATRLSVPAQNLSSSEVAGLHWLFKFCTAAHKRRPPQCGGWDTDM